MPTLPHWRSLAGIVCLLLAQATSAAQQLQANEPAAGAPRGAYLSPLLPGHHRLALNGIATHYEVLGQGPLLVVPAPGHDLAALASRFTLVVYDVPPNVDSADHLESLRRYLKQEKIDLLGQAQGSAPAYASRYPDRVRRLMIDHADTSTERISKFFLSDE